ncbi:MAG: hypothetical protein K2X87_11530 [Gemmataceae bacterium]|nr:hypothetical protein [Gemmataceae bacterium]
MIRSVLCLLAAAGLAAAQPPKADPPGNPDPIPPPGRPPAAARAAREEVELLEAHLATKQAYVKAAEVAVEGPKVRLTRLARLAAAGTVTEDEVEAAKVEVKLAEAQLAIRKAEANEVAVRLKHARARVERTGKQAAAEPELRRLAEAAEKARAEAARTGATAEQLRVRYETMSRTYDPNTPVILNAERTLKAARARAEAAEAKAAATEAEIDRQRAEIEGKPGMLLTSSRPSPASRPPRGRPGCRPRRCRPS